ncbi:GNAT family N-acetyltransferase [Pararhodobacter sp. SW119]|uniref:GNAT family N-acetyltransferase n=1 Tax=Pararhodobacter sp. SW119 TaxID=2780075 RepID=UPI001AE06702|nr:GNAT family N-acetyltransferase [Pararhodobacter sp. SW119]
MSAPHPQLTGVPVLETARLILRAPAPRDFEPFAAYCAADRSRFTGGPLNRDLAWRAFCAITGNWVQRGYAFFVIEERASGRAIGMAGPWCPEGWPEPEIGWQIWDPVDEGQGFAREAAEAARGFAYDVLGWPTAISLIVEDNARSQALARRLGCTPGGVFTHERLGSCAIWRHPAPGTLADGGMEAYA